jgi:hypothetical protein
MKNDSHHAGSVNGVRIWLSFIRRMNGRVGLMKQSGHLPLVCRCEMLKVTERRLWAAGDSFRHQVPPVGLVLTAALVADGCVMRWKWDEIRPFVSWRRLPALVMQMRGLRVNNDRLASARLRPYWCWWCPQLTDLFASCGWCHGLPNIFMADGCRPLIFVLDDLVHFKSIKIGFRTNHVTFELIWVLVGLGRWDLGPGTWLVGLGRWDLDCGRSRDFWINLSLLSFKIYFFKNWSWRRWPIWKGPGHASESLRLMHLLSRQMKPITVLTITRLLGEMCRVSHFLKRKKKLYCVMIRIWEIVVFGLLKRRPSPVTGGGNRALGVTYKLGK